MFFCCSVFNSINYFVENFLSSNKLYIKRNKLIDALQSQFCLLVVEESLKCTEFVKKVDIKWINCRDYLCKHFHTSLNVNTYSIICQKLLRSSDRNLVVRLLENLCSQVLRNYVLYKILMQHVSKKTQSAATEANSF